MVNPVFIFALATSGLGLWELVTGRPLFGATRWPLNQRATRWYGAYTLTGSLVVVVLAVTYSSGVAFITFGLMALFMAATIQVVQNRKPTL
jgi:hypothetical protein